MNSNWTKHSKPQKETNSDRFCLACSHLPERDDLMKMIRETHLAVVGNEEYGVKGLIKRVDEVEQKQQRLTLKAIGVVCLILGGCVGVKEVILSVFGK